MKKYFPVILIILCLASCRKEDLLDENYIGSINLNEEFGTRFASSSILPDYSQQAYFDLGTNQNVGANPKFSWDIAVSNTSNAIHLNASKSNLRGARVESNWEETTSLDNIELGYDAPQGNIEGLAIGIYHDQVFIVDRGLDQNNEPIGPVKVMVSIMEEDLSVKVANLDGSNESIFIATRDNNFNHTYFSFDTGATQVQPEKDSWDLWFTSYLHVFDPETEPFPYQVTGCMINPNNVRVLELENANYDSISSEDFITTEASSDLDVIGYDWKVFDFDLGFVVDENRVYIIQDTDSDLYKLVFTSFYDSEGNKGNPQFTYQKLQ